MPDLKDILNNINSTPTNTTNNIPTSLSIGDLANLATQRNLTINPGLNTGVSNPNFDPTRVESNEQISNTLWSNAYNSFRNGIDEINIATEVGKLNYDAGEYLGTGAVLGANLGAEAIIDNYPQDISKLDSDYAKGGISTEDYTKQRSNLDMRYTNAQSRYEQGQQYIKENQDAIDNRIVSNTYKAKSQNISQRGDDAGFVDTMLYSFPQTFGSSMSLMVPQLAATFGSQFVKAATATVAGTLGAGTEIAPIIGTAAGIVSSIAEIAYGRAQESYGEIGSTIQDARQSMIAKYMQDNRLISESEIPQDIMRDIRTKSRKGADMQFKENMALATQDVISALMMPMNTLGKTLGLGKGLGVAEEAVSDVINYNKLTKGLYRIGQFRAQGLLEQYEEGFQYAAQKRSENSIYGLDNYTNKGFLNNLLTDSYNTAASLNYTIAPMITPDLRGDGKYALDKEFQNSDNSGFLLSAIMGGGAHALSLGKEIQAYKAAKKDLITNGLFDIDSKFERLNADILAKYFAKGKTDRLVDAIKSVGNKEDANGNVYYTPEQGESAISDIKRIYKLYQNVSDNLDGMRPQGFLGLFNSKEQNQMKQMVLSDTLTTALNIQRQRKQIDIANSDKTDILGREYMSGDNVETNTYKDLLSKKYALENLIKVHSDNTEINKTAPENILTNLQSELENINTQIQTEREILESRNFDTSTISDPSSALNTVNNTLYVLDEYNKAQKDKFSKLAKIRTDKDLVNYYKDNSNRTDVGQVTEDVGVDPNLTETRTPSDSITDSISESEQDTSTPEEGLISHPIEAEITPEVSINTNTENIVSTVPKLDIQYNTSGLSKEELNTDLKRGLQLVATTPFSAKEVEDLFKLSGGLDIRNSSVSSIVNRMKESLDPEYLASNFDTFKGYIAQIKNIDPESITLNSVDNIPEEILDIYDSTKVDSDNKNIINKTAQLFGEPSINKLSNPSAISTRLVGFEGRSESYDSDGKLIFKDSGDDQHITDTNSIQIGTQLSFELIDPKQLDNINLSNPNLTLIGNDININDSLNPLDEVEIGIYTTIGGSKLLLGYLHKIGYYTPESFQNPELSVSDARQITLTQRLNLIRGFKNNPNTSFYSTVTNRGFGHLSLNQKGTLSTIKNSIGSDTRPYVTIANEVGIPLNIPGKVTSNLQGELKPGSSLLMLPTETNDGTVYVPTYLTKQTISNDQNVHKQILTGLEQFLTGNDNVWGSGIDQWLYTIQNNPAKIRSLKLNGIGLQNNLAADSKTITINNIKYSYNRTAKVYQIQDISGPNHTVTAEEFTNGVNRNGLNIKGLNQAIGDLYPTFNKSLLTNEKLRNSYIDKIIRSPLFTTRATQNSILNTSDYQFLENNQKYQYFSQHTIEFDATIRSNEVSNTPESKLENTLNTNTIKSDNDLGEPDKLTSLITKRDGLIQLQDMLGGTGYTTQIAELNTQIDSLDSTVQSSSSINTEEELNNSADELGLDLPDDLSYDIDLNIEDNEDNNYNDKLFIDKNRITYSAQQDIINSVSYLLLNNESEDVDESLKNSDKVKELFTSKVAQFRSLLSKVNQTTLPEKYTQISKIIGYYEATLDNWDTKVIPMATDFLESIGFVSDEQNGYYDNLEENLENVEETEAVQFDDDSSRTRDIREFIPSEVKKLLFFISSYRKLNPRVVNDKKIIDSTSKEYTNSINIIGMPAFNNFNDTWVKILNITSSMEFPSDRESGWIKLMTVLSDKSNPYVVQELALKLQKVPSKIQNAFFTSVVLQRQNNLVTRVNYNQSGNKKTSKIINADRNSTINSLVTKMKSDFEFSNKITKAGKDNYGNTIRIVNTTYGKELFNQSQEILDNPISYTTNKKNIFSEGIIDQLYNIITNAGINTTLDGFNNLLNNYFVESVKASQVQAYKFIFQTKILNTLGGTNIVNNPISIDDNNPFIKDSNRIKEIAIADTKYRNDLQYGSFRQGGKSYFPFIKPHYLSEKIGKLVEYSNKKVKDVVNTITPNNIIKIDSFASTSRYLTDISNKTPNGLGINYELGSGANTANSQIKMLKEMTPREHQITKLTLFQNTGNKVSYFLYDTLSDKSTMPLVSHNKIIIGYKGFIDNNTFVLDGETLDILMNYASAEVNRILEVQDQNLNLPASQHIKAYHGKGGMGSRFIMYHFLNKEMLDINNSALSSIMYDSNGNLLELTPDSITGIKNEINNHFNTIISNNKQDILGLDLIENSKQGKLEITTIANLADWDYLTNGNNSVFSRLGLNTDPNYTKVISTGNIAYFGKVNVDRIIDYVISDYVVNYSAHSMEMLQITGDPAQAAKLEKIDFDKKNSAASKIRNKYKNDPNAELLEKRDVLLLHINATLNNLSKRNAAFMGSGGKGLFKQANYNVSVAKDIPINIDNSEIVKYYISLFPDREKDIIKAYQDGDMTDAQEFTTVREKLTVMEAFAKIDREQFLAGLYKYDKEDFNRTLNNPLDTEYDEFKKFADSITQDKLDGFGELIMQPDKPVQRIGSLDSDLSITKQFYIKTSSFPLIPELVKGTPLEDLLNDMKDNKVSRISFQSGVKQGSSTKTKDIFNKDGAYNKDFFIDNIHSLERDGFRIQLEVPYDPGKKAIREGTQQAKMIFVDVDDNIRFNSRTGRELKDLYRELHQDIFDLKKAQFLNEVNAISNPDGTYSFNDLNKFAKVLQEEAIDRGYPLNSIQGLQLDTNGQFKIPLGFNPSVGKLEPVITAIITNRLTKSKLPGGSKVQASEFILRTGKKGRILNGDNLSEVLHTDDKRNILWTDPKYSNTDKLEYLRKDSKGKILPAQLLMTPYISIGGKRINISEYTRDIDGKQYLDTSLLDPSLLESNGFRIPFQGHNSGMWFEIIGFLPETMGDIVIVPSEIAAQMGSDYDVDKLYTYMYNYYTSNGTIKKVDNTTTFNQVNKDIRFKQELVKSELNKRVQSELAANEIFNKFIESEDLKLATDSRIIKDSIMKSVLEDLGIDKSELKFSTQEDLIISIKQNQIIDIHKDIYTGNEDLFTSILNPLTFDLVNQAIDEVDQFINNESELIQYVHDPLYQRNVYFSNSSGKLGTSISALANTSHAQSQETNLFVIGEGFLLSRNNELLSDSIDNNRINKNTEGLYNYKTDEGFVDNSKNNRSAWRLDKVNTFSDANNKIYKISDLISQILGVSVDNAKEQVLSKFGINTQNFNTTLTLIRLGYDLATVKKIITQPILVEYNRRLASLEDMYETEVTIDKRNSALRDLINGIVREFKLPDNYKVDTLLSSEVPILNIEQLESDLGVGEVNQSNATDQLLVLRSWLHLQQISDSLQAVQRAYNMDSQGLPKNLSDVNTKVDNIRTINNSLTIGNINRYTNFSLPGVYKETPYIAKSLFLDGDNAIFNYNKLGYTNLLNDILISTGRNTFYSNQKDIVNNNFKGFIYSGFINSISSLNSVKRELLIDNPIYNKYKSLIQKYPRDKFLTSIIANTDGYENEPVFLEIPISSEDNFVQKISEAWQYDYEQNVDTELKQFAKDFFTYTLAVSPQEFGTSSIVRYIPFSMMEEFGLTFYLQNVNSNLTDYRGLDTFNEQFLQHNVDFAQSVKGNSIIQNSIKTLSLGGNNNIVSEFSLSDPNGQYAAKSLLIETLPGIYIYPTYVSYYSNDLTGKRLYRLTNNDEGYTYQLLPSLGKQNVYEYDNTMTNQNSMLVWNRYVTGQSIDSNALLELFNTDTSNSAILVDNSNVTMDNIISKSKSVDDVITGLSAITSKYSTSDNKYNKKMGQYYGVLLDALNTLDYNDVDIQFVDEGMSSTSSNGRRITINKKMALSLNNKAKLNSDLNSTRVILHEMLHSAIFRGNRNSNEFKQIQNIYNNYRDTIYNSKGTIRGVNSETLIGEILGVLVNNAKLQSGLSITSILDTSNLTDEAITGLLRQVQPQLEQLAKENKIDPKLSLYDLTNSLRVNDFIKFVRDNFNKQNITPVVNKYYGYTDINEFITESVTNPETQKYLKAIPSIWEGLLDSISNLLAKLFNIEPRDRSLFNDAIDAVFNFITPDLNKNNNTFVEDNSEQIYRDYTDHMDKLYKDKFGDESPFDIDPLASNTTSDINTIFEETPELSNIGNKEEYISYLNTIYPNSKVKDILYHGGNAGIEKFDHDKLGEKTNANSAMLGFFFSNNKAVSLSYIETDIVKSTGELERLGKEYDTKYKEFDLAYQNSSNDLQVLRSQLKSIVTRIVDIIKKLLNNNYITISEKYRSKLQEFQENSERFNNLVNEGKPKSIPFFDMYEVTSEIAKDKYLYRSILNIENPFIVDKEDFNDEIFYSGNIKKSISLGHDSTILQNVIDPGKEVITANRINPTTNESERIVNKEGDLYKNTYIGNDYVVYNSDQIHILGSKDDINGFKNYITNSKVSIEDIQNLPCA